MSKLLVNTPNEIQEIIEIGEGGEYFDINCVIWDERVDGDMPTNITIGAMKKEGKTLIYDDLLYQSYIAFNNKIKIKEKIAQLELIITSRRTREAILGTDNGWLAEKEAAIALLRQQLTEL